MNTWEGKQVGVLAVHVRAQAALSDAPEQPRLSLRRPSWTSEAEVEPGERSTPDRNVVKKTNGNARETGSVAKRGNRRQRSQV